MTQDPESEARPSALVFDGATDSVGELRLPQRESEMLPMADGPKMAGSYFSRRETVCTEQLSAAEHLASEIFFTPHRLRYSRRGQRLNARLSAARIGAVTVGYLRYGADVELVNSTALDDYHINVPPHQLRRFVVRLSHGPSDAHAGGGFSSQAVLPASSGPPIVVSCA